MSKTRATGATKLGRDSRPKYLGVKVSAGQKVKAGGIIIKQRGTKFIPGDNVRRGSDDTLYSVKDGVVSFNVRKKKGFQGSTKEKRVVSVT